MKRSHEEETLCRPPDHPVVLHGKIGVLLVNLGTPNGTDYWSIWRYLKEFLSDRRVIEINRLLWWLLLHLVILPFRSSRSGHAYDQIWDRDHDESPLRVLTRAQSRALSARLSNHDSIIVDWAMRYGQPSISSVLDNLIARGCTRILLFPLYPQYSATTTATVNDAAFKALERMRWQPALRTVPPYHDDPVYMNALVSSLTSAIAALDFEPERLVVSFHGLPRSYLDKGDPYYCHCSKTGRLLREALGWSEDRMIVTFQSRFGRQEWLQPYTSDVIETLAKEGVKAIAVITPGFVSDCIETLEEISMQGRDSFKENGGERFATIACLNDSKEGMDVIEHVVRRELSGWI